MKKLHKGALIRLSVLNSVLNEETFFMADVALSNLNKCWALTRAKSHLLRTLLEKKYVFEKVENNYHAESLHEYL